MGGLRGRGLGSGIRRFGDRKLSGVIRSRELGLNSSRRLSGRMRAWSSPALMEDGENGIAGFRRFSEGAWGMSDSRVGDAVGRGKGEDRRIVDDFAEIRDHYGEFTFLWFIRFVCQLLFSHGSRCLCQDFHFELASLSRDITSYSG